jgi:hypothetical protein
MRQSLDASRRKVIVLVSGWMRESIRPVAGAVTPLALMGIRYLRPHKIIGLQGLVVYQATKKRPRRAAISNSPRIHCGSRGIAIAIRLSSRVFLLSCQDYPSNSRSLVGERDDGPVDAASNDQGFEPLRPSIVMVRHPPRRVMSVEMQPPAAQISDYCMPRADTMPYLQLPALCTKSAADIAGDDPNPAFRRSHREVP